MKKQRRIKIELVIPATIRETEDRVIITFLPNIKQLAEGTYKLLVPVSSGSHSKKPKGC